MAPETRYFEQEIELSVSPAPQPTRFPARVAYWAIGDSSKPAILMPTCYGGTLAGTTPFLYSSDNDNAPIFDPNEYFIIVTALLGGSESSSPSNTPAPFHGVDFPKTTYEDNIRLQHALCLSLGVTELFVYIGFSMGGQQAYHMVTLFPDFAKNMVCIAGSARTSAHNWCFLEGPRYALITAEDFHGGRYQQPARKGTLAFARVYSTWALSQAWFREKCWEKIGFDTLQAYLDAEWSFETDANDLLCLLATWQHGDITRYHAEDQGDLAKTLARIKARCLIMPCRTDEYFPPEDNEIEVRSLRHGELRVIETIWGHIAGAGAGTAEDTAFIKREIAQFLGLKT